MLPGEIVGSPDDMKIRSSMTLFLTAAGDGEEKYYGGQADPLTLDLLNAD